MDSPNFFCIKHDEPVKNPKFYHFERSEKYYISYYANIIVFYPFD